jgi:hypothetical protein
MSISKIINDGIGDISELTVDTNTLVVDSTNNRVGIGTTSPDSKFVVSEGASATGLEINPLDASERIDIYGFDRGSSVYRDLRFIADEFRIETGSSSATERMRIDSSGRVGIGNSSPTYKLDVLDNSSGNVITRIKNSNAGTSARAGFYIDADDGNKVNLLATSSAYTGVGSWQDAAVLNASSLASGGLIMNAQGGDIKFQRALTEKVRITSSGLTFNGDTAAANALDDYEEGTWTATTDQGTLSSSSVCKYVKVGNLVTVSGLVSNFSNRTSTGAVVIRGLPFATGSTDIAIGATLSRYINATGDQTSLYLGGSRSYILFYNMNQGTNYDQVRHADLNNTNANFHFTLSYRAA